MHPIEAALRRRVITIGGSEFECTYGCQECGASWSDPEHEKHDTKCVLSSSAFLVVLAEHAMMKLVGRELLHSALRDGPNDDLISQSVKLFGSPSDVEDLPKILESNARRLAERQFPVPDGRDYCKGWEDGLDRAQCELRVRKMFDAENVVGAVPRVPGPWSGGAPDPINF